MRSPLLFARGTNGQPHDSGPPRPPEPPVATATEAMPSFLARDLVVDGSITAKGDLTIEGQVNGNIRCAKLIQGLQSDVRGNITADSARLAGSIKGGIEVGEVVLQSGAVVTGDIVTADIRIESRARVTGDIAYRTIQIDAGARVDGRLTQREADPDQRPRLVSSEPDPAA